MATGGRRSYDWRSWAGADARPPASEPKPPAPEDLATPDRRVRHIRSSALNGLFILGCIYTLAIARSFLVPVAVGLMLYFLLRPPVRTLKAARVPEPLGAALVLTALLAVVGVGFYALSWPAAAWTSRAPESLQRVEAKLRPIVHRIQRLTHTAEQMGRITEATAPSSPTPQVTIREPSLGTMFLGGMQSFLAATVVVLSMVYFLLSEGDGLLRKVVRAFPRLKDRERAVAIAHEMEQQISGYIFFSTLMNAIFGVFIGALMWLLGMPNPMLWGFVAGVTKFIPYLGGLVCAVVLAMASIVAFDDVFWALLVPGVFLAVDTVHGNVLMPLLLGKRFTLDPAVLFVGLFFWWFVWGTAGALLAVPMMSALRIFCDHVEGLQRFGHLLGGTDADEAPAGESVPRSG